MRSISLVLFILFMILLVTKPNLISCRALRSGRTNETNDHHEPADIDDHGFGSVSITVKDSAPVKDAGSQKVLSTVTMESVIVSEASDNLSVES
ncbi:hypothetical protein DKX38_011263 [Salix brachista]|uniref:Uncharacterized protein n=1 Tax=Salix brachista TaxID=2182728 RepID=A0A5N5LYM5_9ROSI|nr:hypothetical protein DKX38_011263 [Salix brachista]